MHAVPHLCAHPGSELPHPASAPLLRHPHLLPGAHLHLQDPAGCQAHPSLHSQAQVLLRTTGRVVSITSVGSACQLFASLLGISCNGCSSPTRSCIIHTVICTAWNLKSSGCYYFPVRLCTQTSGFVAQPYLVFDCCLWSHHRLVYSDQWLSCLTSPCV